MDDGSIIQLIQVIQYVGVAQISDGKRFGHSSSLKQRFTWGGFDTWCTKVRIIDYLREKLNWCGFGLGWMSYVTLELFSFETGLFSFMIDKSSVIDVIQVSSRVYVVWDSYM